MLKFATAQIIAASLGDQKRITRAAHRAVFQYEARPGFLYVRSRAISSRCNDNFDEFPSAEIEASYRTFVGKPVFVNHVNDNHRRARGVIIDAALHKDKNPDGTPDTWAEVLMEIDAVRFPKLAKAILKGEVDRTSMGCDVERSVCSACGNEARTPAEYCSHIPHLKGKRIFRASMSGKKVGELVRETCYGLRFFENSVLVEPPADPTAHFLGVDSSGIGKAASKTATSGLQATAATLVQPRQDSHVEISHGDDGPPPAMEDWGGGDGGAKNQFLITRHRPDYYSLINGVSDDHPHRYVSYHDSVEDALHALGHAQHSGSYSPSEVRYAPKMNAKRTTSMDPEYHNHYGKWFDKNSPNYDPNPHVAPSHDDMSDDELRHHMEGAHSAKPGIETAKLRAHHNFWHNTNDWFEGSQSGCLSSRGKPCNYRSPGGHTHAPSFKGMFGDTNLDGLMDDGSGPSKFSSLQTEAAPKKKPAPKAAQPELDEYGTPKPKRGQPYEPASNHPWYKQVPLHHDNIVAHWDKATDEEKDSGMRWYSDAHHVAKAIAKLDPNIKTDEEAAHKGAGVLSAYSPRTNWPQNMFNAAHSFHRQAAVRPLKDDPDKPAHVVTMGMHADKAQRIMDGEHHQPVLKAPKTQDFAHLIEHGGYEPQTEEEKKAGAKPRLSGRVVVDRHALSVAAGRRITDVENDAHSGFPGASGKHARHYYEHAAEQYRNAAAAISEKEGKPVAGHQVQAVTWLVRQRLNEAEDAANARAVARAAGQGRKKNEENIKGHWKDFAGEHTPELKEQGNSHTARLIDAAFINDDGTIRAVAYGEIKAPADVDTLREENCPVCGDKDTFDGMQCQICGFINPPEQFRDPDLDKAKTMDLRKQVVDPTLIDNNGELQRVDQGGNAMPQDAQGGDPQAQDPSAMQDPNDPQMVDPSQLDENGLTPSPYGDQALDGTQRSGPASSDRNGDGMIQPDEIDPDGNVSVQQGMPDPEQGGQPAPRELPYRAQDHTGDPFTPGPDMPYRPDQPDSPNEKLDQDDAPYGRATTPMMGQPGDGVADLLCPNCGFGADATPPQTQDMGNPDGPSDGIVAGDVCPSCQRAQLLTPGEVNSNYSKAPAVEKPAWS